MDFQLEYCKPTKAADVRAEQGGFDFGDDAGKLAGTERDAPGFVACGDCVRPCGQYLKVKGCVQI